MQKKSSDKADRIPQPLDNIQINFCKNPICPNFGIPASTKNQSRGPYVKPLKQDGYIRKKKGGFFHLLCKYCGESFPLKSNQGIAEEAANLHSPKSGIGNTCCLSERVPS